ncbi:AAA family ATPase [Inquilinus sp. Marseille-Q2685]|uniref:AAA family ATPase n=1 Tax=Inquilinus sp. Marseille-Q2685 TaxID=2866581 RepID=UPI001CE405EE|nr:AAA family ATPase [Inquilinus sp. Marseille-Q2685]
MPDDPYQPRRREVIHRTPTTTVTRAVLGDGRPVILKEGLGEPAVGLLDRLRREHEILSRFESDLVVRPVGLQPDGPEGPALVLEDVGGIALSEWIADAPPDLAGRIAIAEALALGLAHVHERGVLHGDLSAHNIVIDPATRRVNYIDFGGAVALDRGASIPAEALPAVEDLTAVAPERTGRMNRPVDHRADLYSLGAVLYQLFAGRPPFAGEERLELLHAHLAQRPVPLDALLPEFPPVLAEIVAALLMKDAAARYGNAADLVADLGRCRIGFAPAGVAGGRIAPFAITAGRGGDSFGDELYGRAAALTALQEAFETARGDRGGAVLITGAPGLGKSALPAGLRDRVAEAGGHFAAGKFEQQRDEPYSGLVQAFAGLVRGVLTEPDAVVAAWRTALLDRLGRSASVLAELVPGLDRLIGPQPPAAVLAPAEAGRRLAQAVHELVAVFATPDHPLVLLLDDLQWADAASLELLGPICAAAPGGGLLLVGTCRDGDPGPALRDTLEALDAQPGGLRRIDLQPLAPEDIEAMLTAAYPGRPDQATAAAALVHAKTLGNPLFARQLLGHLRETGAIGPSGNWDLDRIAAVDATDNVVGFLADRIGHLPAELQRVVTTSACLGMQVDAQVLGAVLGLDDAHLRRILGDAVAEGLMVVRDGGVGFAHDRIREAAYRLAAEPAVLHRRIALLLLERTGEAQLPGAAFAIARHLNAAGDLDHDPALRARCAEINLIAARQARATAAFAPARDYAETGLRLTDPGFWETRYTDIAEAALLLAECRMLTQDHAAFDREAEELAARLRTDEHRLQLAMLRLLSFDARSMGHEAIEAGRQALRLVGIELPATVEQQREAVGAEFAEFQRLMAGRPAEALLDLPPLRDRRLAAAMQILFRLAPDAHDTLQPELFALMALRNANLMLQHGSDALAPGIIVTLALTLRGLTGDSVTADALGRTAIALDARLGHPLTASVTFVYSYFLQHWLHPLENALQLNLDGIRAGFEMGDIQFAAYHAATYVIHLACNGGALPEVVRAGEDHLRLIGDQNRTAAVHCRLEVDFAAALMGRTAAPTSLARDRVRSEAEEEDHLRALGFAERSRYLIRRLQLALLFRDLDAARRLIAPTRANLPGVDANVIEADGVTTLLLAALADGGDRGGDFAAQRDRLRAWSTLNPHNFGAMDSLVEAELARADGRAGDALRLYGDAIRRAEAGKLTHYAALANEYAGRCCLGLGNEVAGMAHLREAAALYGYWGASAKVTALEQEFPRLAARSRTGRASLREPGSPAGEDDIDFRAVLRAAHSISREIDLPRLVQRVLGAIQESAGASYGVLVLRREDGLHVEAVGRDREVSVLAGDGTARLEASDALPQSVLSYVLRTREALVLDNAQHSPEFLRDPYIRANRVASVLCAPLDERGQVDGLIYLENNLAAGVFSPRRLEVVQVLAAQAAIALANARLFTALDGARTELLRANEGLEQKVSERTAELDAARNRAVAKEREARRARRAAEVANQAKSRFLAVVSHEIRTPMNGVLGMLQILDRDPLPEEQRRYLEIAEESGRSLLDLIDGILDYARLENSREALDLHDFDLHRLVADAIELIRPQAAAKGLALTLSIDAPPEAILHSDPRRLGRVLINLLSNAVKFTSEGGIAVTVGLDPMSGAMPRSTLHMAVTDTGIGIAPDMHERIFGDFIQADSSIARRYGGTGLGLAICRRIADLLGGTLTVDSAPGRGSTFRLAVPVTPGTARPEAPAPVAAGPALSVLVVDDDPINRAVAAGLLGRLGHRVTLADGGQAAIEAAAAGTFDVVMMDLHMPGMDGLEATRRIRALPGDREPPHILALTADLTDGSRQRCALAGIERILGKPLQLATLQRMLAAISDSRPPVEQPAASADPTALVDREFYDERHEILGIRELARLALMFHRVSRPMVRAIGAAADGGDRSSLARLAHRLSSSAGALGLVRLARHAATIEACAGDDVPVDGLADMAAALVPLRRLSIDALMAEIRRSAAQPRASVRTPSL